MNNILSGTTREFYWINSGVTPDQLVFNLVSGSETLVTSGNFVSSGNGHYYFLLTAPSVNGFYSAASIASIGGKPYVNKELIKIINSEVD